jgi:predicted amidohydrolase YtcJ
MVKLTAPRLGPDRTAHQYPIGSLMRGGASISFGSDWPVSSPNPLEGISVAVTRTDPEHPEREPFLPSEAIDIESALLAYTNGVAYQAGQVLDWGLIRINGRADLTLLGDDPRAVDPADLGKISVEGTWLGGQRVWG